MWGRAVVQLAAVMSHNTEARLGRVAVPTLVVHGDEDLVVPVENGRRLAARIPRARLVILPGIGHLYVPT
jgi:3-oxoadipate enol-lactonase